MATITEAIKVQMVLQSRDFENKLKKSGASVDKFNRTATSATASLKRFGGGFLALAGIGGAIGAIAKVTRSFANFETRMAEVSTIVDTANINVEGLSESVLNLSRTVPQTADDLGAGLYQVFSSGVTDANEAMSVLNVSARAATAGLSTTAVAVDATTTVLNAYRLSASQAMNINDVFFETVKQGKITYDQLAGSIGQVANTASLAGVTIEEIAASVATMTKSGISADETMTALNNLMLKIISPTKEASNAAKKLGIDLSSAGIRSKGFAGFLAELNEKAGDNIDLLTQIVPDIRSFRAASVIAGTGAAEFAKQLGNMNNASGNVNEAFDKMNGTMNNQFQLLKNNLNATFIELGKTILPGVVLGMRTLNTWLLINKQNVSAIAKVFTGVGRIIGSQIKTWILNFVILKDFVKEFIDGVMALDFDIVAASFTKAKKKMDKTQKDLFGNIKKGIDEIATGFEEFDVSTFLNVFGPVQVAVSDLVIDTDEFNQSLADAQKEARGIKQPLLELPAAIDDMSNSLAGSHSIMSAFKEQIPTAKNFVGSLTQEVSGLVTELLLMQKTFKDFVKDLGLLVGNKAVGALVGAGVGAAIGSIVPGVGTALGAGIGFAGGLFKSGSAGRIQNGPIPMARSGMEIGNIGSRTKMIGVHSNEGVANASFMDSFERRFGRGAFAAANITGQAPGGDTFNFHFGPGTSATDQTAMEKMVVDAVQSAKRRLKL